MEYSGSNREILVHQQLAIENNLDLTENSRLAVYGYAKLYHQFELWFLSLITVLKYITSYIAIIVTIPVVITYCVGLDNNCETMIIVLSWPHDNHTVKSFQYCSYHKIY